MSLKQLKQIIQIKHNIVKNPNWPEADQLAIYNFNVLSWLLKFDSVFNFIIIFSSWHLTLFLAYKGETLM